MNHYLVLTSDYFVVSIDHLVVTSDYVVMTSECSVVTKDYLVLLCEYLVVTRYIFFVRGTSREQGVLGGDV